MKTYQQKSSAVRAAKQAGLVVNESAEIYQNEDGTWGFLDRTPMTADDMKDEPFVELDAYGEEVGEVEDLDVTGGDWGDSENDSRVLGEDLGLNTTRCPSCHREGNLETEKFADDAGLPQTKITCNHCGWFHAEEAEKPFEEIAEKEHAEHRGEKRSQSAVDKPCSLVWDIAESMPGAKRKEVLAVCAERGVAFYTARTQYQLWLTATRNSTKK